MKKSVSALMLFLLFVTAIFPCGPGYITPIFEYEHAPENPFENFASGKIGILEAVWKLKEMNQKAKIVNYQLSIVFDRNRPFCQSI